MDLTQVNKAVSIGAGKEQTPPSNQMMLALFGTQERTDKLIQMLNDLSTYERQIKIREWRLIDVSFDTKQAWNVKQVLLETGLNYAQSKAEKIPQVVNNYIQLALNKSMGYVRIPMEKYKFPIKTSGKMLAQPYVFPIAMQNSQREINALNFFKEYEK